jgi:hypothetical protein
MKHSHHVRRMPVPVLEPLGDDELNLVRIAAARIFLPHPKTVAQFPEAVFPTIRNPRKREQPVESEGRIIGMYDDNTTPRWALLWAHGIPGKSKQPTKGWTISHVWDRSKDINAYTHLANLALLPEYLGSLSDKQGPLTHHLRFHAWHVYRWRPEGSEMPVKPSSYDAIEWRYFDPIDDPVGFLRAEFSKGNCGRCKALQPLLHQAIAGGV